MLMKNIYIGFLIQLRKHHLKIKIKSELVYHLYSILDMLFLKMVSWFIPRKQ